MKHIDKDEILKHLLDGEPKNLFLLESGLKYKINRKIIARILNRSHKVKCISTKPTVYKIKRQYIKPTYSIEKEMV